MYDPMSRQLSNTQHNMVNYTHHAVGDIPGFTNLKPGGRGSDPVPPSFPPSLPPLAIPPHSTICSPHWCLTFQIPHVSEARQCLLLASSTTECPGLGLSQPEITGSSPALRSLHGGGQRLPVHRHRDTTGLSLPNSHSRVVTAGNSSFLER